MIHGGAGPPFTRRVENQPQALRRAARDRGAAEQEAETARWNDAVSELRKVYYPLVNFCRKDKMWKAMFLFRLEEERDWDGGQGFGQNHRFKHLYFPECDGLDAVSRHNQFAVAARCRGQQRLSVMVEFDDRAERVVPVLFLPPANRQHVIEAKAGILLPKPQHRLQIVRRKSEVDDVLC